MAHFLSCTEALLAPPPDPPNKKTLMVVAAALINRKKQILIGQRPMDKDMGGLWEFPGGKIEPGETPEFALMRELREELAIETRPCGMMAAGFTSHTYPDFHLLMPLFMIRVWKGDPTPLVHQNLQWVHARELYHLGMPEADLPLISVLESILGI